MSAKNENQEVPAPNESGIDGNYERRNDDSSTQQTVSNPKDAAADQEPPQGSHGPILRRKVLGERGHGPVVHPKRTQE